MNVQYLFVSFLMMTYSSVVLASNFAPLLMFFHGFTVIVGAVICIAVFKHSKKIVNQYKRVALKCAAISLCFTPVYISGGNGSFEGLVLEAILIGVFGGDIKYFTYGVLYILISFILLYAFSMLFVMNQNNVNNNS